MGENAELAIDEFVYRPGETRDIMLRALKGALLLRSVAMPVPFAPLLLGFGLAMSNAESASPVAAPSPLVPPTTADERPSYRVEPIGWVRKGDGRTTIELYEEYQPALLGVVALDAIWVLYWFDRNDTPAQRAILQVHPRADPSNPLRGVFATRAPVRPNLIAMTRCRVLSVQGNIIEIDGIDAFADTPVLDIKP
ncbi:MAG: tRNA (N6-threonylcarbamoyladenosine(37)-N6)-methyltransferase TrmO [Thiohalocapsa sp.]